MICSGEIGMLPITGLDPQSEVPLYRQIFDRIRFLIDSGSLEAGSKLPPTRELAGQLGLNRATVASAYELLESDGLIAGHVGRGSFVCGPPRLSGAGPDFISLANSRPSELLFPVEEFRAACAEVIRGSEALDILQLGPPGGYARLRRYLLEQARAEGTATTAGDDVLITSGCQQAFDLLQRTYAANGETVLVEDPVYPGVKNVFQRAGARVIGIPTTREGVDPDKLAHAASRQRPALIILTPNFQNPTGTTMPLASRERVMRTARDTGAVLVENDIYGELRYTGQPVPLARQLDPASGSIVLRSFSKLAFPGLRVGWAIGPRSLIEQLTVTKQWSDLHSDQLSQAVLLRFAESGRLAQHKTRVLRTGGERLRAVLRACEAHLPAGSEWTRPEGGMNIWVKLPEALDAGELLPEAERSGAAYLPGAHFAVGLPDRSALRISFAGVPPERIDTGVRILGEVFSRALERSRDRLEAAIIV